MSTTSLLLVTFSPARAGIRIHGEPHIAVLNQGALKVNNTDHTLTLVLSKCYICEREVLQG